MSLARKIFGQSSRARSGTGALLVLSLVVGLIAALPSTSVAVATGPSIPFGATSTQVGDFNGDGKADVLSKRSSDDAWLVSWSGTSLWWAHNGGAFDPAKTWVADMNGDGKDDIFTVYANNMWKVSYSASGAWTYLNQSGLPVGRTWLGDLNGDGKDDVFWVDPSNNWSVSYSGTGPAVLLASGRSLNPNATWLADMNGDGKDDVFSMLTDGRWMVSYGGTSAWTLLPVGGVVDPSRVWLADMNGDHKSDVFYVHTDTSSTWLVSDAGSALWSTINWGPGMDLSQTWLADFNGDGKDDVFSVTGVQWIVSYSGTSLFQPINGGVLPSGHSAIATLDWKGDPVASSSDWAPGPPTADLDTFEPNPVLSQVDLGAEQGSVESEVPDDELDSVETVTPNLVADESSYFSSDPFDHSESLAGSNEPYAASASKSTCNMVWDRRTAKPTGVQTGKNFAIAKQVTSSAGVETTSGGIQAEVVHGATLFDGHQVFKTSEARVQYSVGFRWPANAPVATVNAHLRPSWRGQIPLRPQTADIPGGGDAEASAHVYIGGGFKDKTTSNPGLAAKRMLNVTPHDQGSAGNKYYFSYDGNQSGYSDWTLGISLTPGHRYVFYAYAATTATAETDRWATAGSSVDFGSRFLNTPADQNKVIDGSPVNGFFSPGSSANGAVRMVFKAKGYNVRC